MKRLLQSILTLVLLHNCAWGVQTANMQRQTKDIPTVSRASNQREVMIPELTQQKDGEYIINKMFGYLDARSIQSYMQKLSTARKLLEGKNSTGAFQRFIELIKQMQQTLQTMLNIKNKVALLLNKKINFAHHFIDDSAESEAILYMMDYIDIEKLQEKAKDCNILAQSPNANEKVREIGGLLTQFITAFNELHTVVESLINLDSRIWLIIDGKNQQQQETANSEGENASENPQLSARNNDMPARVTQTTDDSTDQHSQVAPNLLDASARWHDLPNLLQAFQQFSTELIQDCATADSLDVLLSCMIINLRAMKGVAQQSAINNLLSNLEDQEDAIQNTKLLSEKARILSQCVDIYNRAIQGNPAGLTPIPSSTVNTVQANLILDVFDQLSEKLSSVQEVMNLPRNDTSIETAMEQINNFKELFQKATSTQRKITLLKNAIAAHDEIIQQLSTPQAPEEAKPLLVAYDKAISDDAINMLNPQHATSAYKQPAGRATLGAAAMQQQR